MDMEQFFKIYACAFIGDHLHPDENVKEIFELEDPIEDNSEKWWYWMASTGIHKFRTMFEKCKVTYKDKRPPIFVARSTPLMEGTASLE